VRRLKAMEKETEMGRVMVEIEVSAHVQNYVKALP
jgi:hypothetical protein